VLTLEHVVLIHLLHFVTSVEAMGLLNGNKDWR